MLIRKRINEPKVMVIIPNAITVIKVVKVTDQSFYKHQFHQRKIRRMRKTINTINQSKEGQTMVVIISARLNVATLFL